MPMFSAPHSAVSGLCLLALLSVAACNRDPNVRKQKYLESGNRYAVEKKYAEANIQYFNALKVDKNFSPAHYALAKSYTATGSMNAAFGELLTVVNLSPDNMPARLDLGRLELAGGRPDDAAQQARAVLTAQPGTASAHALLSGVNASKGDRPGALAEIRTAIQMEPGNAANYATLGLLQGSDPTTMSSAEEPLRKAITLDNGNQLAHLALAALLEKKGNLAEAEKQQIAAVAAVPTSLQARASLAAFYLRRNNQPAAEETLRKASAELAATPGGADLLANYFLHNNQLDHGEQAYATLTANDPKSKPLKLAYARLLVQHGNFTKAASIAKDLGTDSADPQVALLNSTLLMQQGKNQEAFDLIQKAQKAAPDNPQLAVMMGLAARNRGDLALAQSSFQQALQRDPGNLSAQRGLAEIAIRKNDVGLLRQLATNAVQITPNLPEGYLWRALAEAAEGRLPAAATDLQTVLQKDPGNMEALVELGQVRIKEGKVAEGNVLLEQALQKGISVAALRLLVGTDLQNKQPEKAIARVQQQIARSPSSAALYGELAQVQLAVHDPTAARASAKHAMELDTSDPAAARIFTQSEIALGDLEPAIAVWQKWATDHPRDPQAPSLLGMLYEASNDAPKAIAAYQKSLQLQPDQPVASNNLAYLLLQNNGNLDVALSLAQSAHSRLPDSPNTADTLAWVYYQKGIYASALDLLQEAAKVDTSSASIQYHLGMTYSKLNDKSNAILHLKQAATLSPNTPIAQEAQQEISRLG